MKTTINKFDYPTAASHTYKKYRQEIDRQTNQQIVSNKNQNKQRYQQVNQEERNNERARVKLQQDRKKQIERQSNMKKIQSEIQNKRRQLMELEKVKQRALEEQRKSYQLALIRQEQQKMNQIQKQRRERENEMNAQNRFIGALKRLESQKDEANRKNKQALMRRKVAQNTQKRQREKAIVYRQTIQEKQKNIQPQEKRSFKNYKQPLGRTAYAKAVDYSTSHKHNPMIVIPNAEQQAINKAEERNQMEQQQSRLRRQNSEQNKKRSMQRGERAAERIRLQQQYQKYRTQEEANAIKYNLERIQAGKKNQYAGLKPATMAQMEVQRKIRREEQFQKMFFGETNPEIFSQPASRYTILQARLGNTDVPLQPVPLCKGNPRSNEAVISDGHYSFQFGEGIDDLTTVKKPEQEGQEIQQNLAGHNQQMNPMNEYDKRREAPNYISNNSRQKQDLNYSESEEEDESQQS